MKLLLLIFTFLILITHLSANTYWVKEPGPSRHNLKNVFFINDQTGWISGDTGTILQTSNSGINWNVQNSGIINDIHSIHFINQRLGWAVAWEAFPDSNSFYGTKILKTTNGGLNWISYMYPDTGRFMNTIYFLDSLRGFMAGAPISIVYTTNAGSTWNKADTDTTITIGFPIVNLNFFDSMTGYACGGFRDIAGAMWKTTNGGINWKATIVGPEPLNDLYLFNSSKVIAAGGDFEYGSSTVRTSDQGSHWLYDTLGVFGVANGIDFRTPYEGWISLGIAQKFIYTLDSGHSWRTIFTPDSIPIFDVTFSDSTNGWAVGYNGTILKYNHGIVNTNNISEQILQNEIILHQNYPNPFNPKTLINYELRNAHFVWLRVYDPLGKLVATLVNSRQERGKHYVVFNEINLSSGIYFYELKAENYSEVKRMIFLK